MSNGDLIFIFASLYILGFVLSIISLFSFGEKMGLDYDEPKTYVNYDDWDNNNEAYTAFSIGWPVFWCGFLIYFSYRLLVKVVGIIGSKLKKK